MFLAYANTESPDQSAHPRCLIMAFTVRPISEAFDITECMNGDQMPGYYFAHAQDDLNPHILRMLEGTFST